MSYQLYFFFLLLESCLQKFPLNKQLQHCKYISYALFHWYSSLQLSVMKMWKLHQLKSGGRRKKAKHLQKEVGQKLALTAPLGAVKSRRNSPGFQLLGQSASLTTHCPGLLQLWGGLQPFFVTSWLAFLSFLQSLTDLTSKEGHISLED